MRLIGKLSGGPDPLISPDTPLTSSWPVVVSSTDFWVMRWAVDGITDRSRGFAVMDDGAGIAARASDASDLRCNRAARSTDRG